MTTCLNFCCVLPASDTSFLKRKHFFSLMCVCATPLGKIATKTDSTLKYSDGIGFWCFGAAFQAGKMRFWCRNLCFCSKKFFSLRKGSYATEQSHCINLCTEREKNKQKPLRMSALCFWEVRPTRLLKTYPTKREFRSSQHGGCSSNDDKWCFATTLLGSSLQYRRPPNVKLVFIFSFKRRVFSEHFWPTTIIVINLERVALALRVWYFLVTIAVCVLSHHLVFLTEKFWVPSF